MRQEGVTPEWPCPYCGREAWNQVYASTRRGRLSPVVCGQCHVMFTAEWVDGCWMGRMREAGWPGGLTDFVEMKAEVLRGKEDA